MIPMMVIVGIVLLFSIVRAVQQPPSFRKYIGLTVQYSQLRQYLLRISNSKSLLLHLMYGNRQNWGKHKSLRGMFTSFFIKLFSCEIYY